MKKLVFLLTICVLWGAAAKAQPLNRSTPEANRKSAEEAEAANNPYEALELYDKVYDETKDKTVAVKIARLEYDLRDYQQAERAFGRLVLRDRKNEMTELKYWYAMSMKYNGKYAEAIDMFNQYISDPAADPGLAQASKREIAGCELGKKAKQPDNLIVNNIGLS